eukprot:scaffold153469_cov32-Tisochrysis_lutea.AAC.5
MPRATCELQRLVGRTRPTRSTVNFRHASATISAVTLPASSLDPARVVLSSYPSNRLLSKRTVAGTAGAATRECLRTAVSAAGLLRLILPFGSGGEEGATPTELVSPTGESTHAFSHARQIWI